MMRWEDLQYREKLAAIGVGLALGLLLLYLLLQPLLGQHARLRSEVEARRVDLAWMRNAAAELDRSGALARNRQGGSPLELIDRAARENQLSGQLKRMEPGTGDEIKVWLESAAYVDLIRWLRQLTGDGQIAIANLTAEKGSAPGRVDARLTFTSTGSTP
jgi:general secretion pathway protein M